VERPAVSLLVLSQNRHPERSASQVDCVTQSWWRGVEEPVLSEVEGTSAVLILPMLLGAFQPPVSHRGTCYVRRLHLPSCHTGTLYIDVTGNLHLRVMSGFCGRNLRAACENQEPPRFLRLRSGQALRLRATSAVSRGQSVRRSTQDDESVGVLTKNTLNKLAFMGPCPGFSPSPTTHG